MEQPPFWECSFAQDWQRVRKITLYVSTHLLREDRSLDERGMAKALTPKKLSVVVIALNLLAAFRKFQLTHLSWACKTMNLGREESSGDNVPRILIVHERRMKIFSLIETHHQSHLTLA